MELPTEETEMEEVEPTAEEIVEQEEAAQAAPVPAPAQAKAPAPAPASAPADDIPRIEKQEVKRKPGRPKKAEPGQQPVAPASRYVAFKQEEQHGIYDTVTKTMYSQEAVLAEILSKVDRIERSIA